MRRAARDGIYACLPRITFDGHMLAAAARSRTCSLRLEAISHRPGTPRIRRQGAAYQGPDGRAVGGGVPVEGNVLASSTHPQEEAHGPPRRYARGCPAPDEAQTRRTKDASLRRRATPAHTTNTGTQQV